MANGKVGKAANGSGIARRLGLLALSVALVAGILDGRPAAAAETRQSFFRSVELASANTEPFTKWHDALARTSREVAAEQGRDCGNDGAGCRYRQLDVFLDTLRDKGRRQQLAAVNAYARAATLAPGNAAIRNNLGQALADAGCITESRAQLARAVALAANSELAPTVEATRAGIEAEAARGADGGCPLVGRDWPE